MSTEPQPVDSLRTVQCTCARLRKITRQVTMLYDQKLAPHGLTVTQFSLLSVLRSRPGASIGTIAAKMIMDPTAVTRAVRPLQRAGLLVMQPDENDRRSRSLKLTDKGTAAFLAARAAWREAQDDVDVVLAAAGHAGLNAVLDDLIQQFQSAQAGTSGT